MDRVSQQSTLVLYVVEMNALRPTGEAGEWQTYVEINGTLLDKNGLNHRLPLNYRGPLRITIPIEQGVLQAGENSLRIFQTPQKDDPRSFDDCGIFGIGLEYSAE
jgi:hypothetical protein